MIITYEYFGYELPVRERYRLIKRAGFDGTVLWWHESFGRGDYRGNALLARKAGLFIENIHTPFEDCNALWLDNPGGNALTEMYLQCVTDCAEYEIPTMVVHPSNGETPPPYNGLGLDRIKRLAEKAEKHGVNIAFENLRKPDYLAYIFDHINSRHIGFCYDSGHHNCFTPGRDLISQFGSRLMALHLHDNDGSGDRHRLPFDGTIDWPATMNAIKNAGYTGATSLESANPGHEDLPPEEFLCLAFERAKKLEGLR